MLAAWTSAIRRASIGTAMLQTIHLPLQIPPDLTSDAPQAALSGIHLTESLSSAVRIPRPRQMQERQPYPLVLGVRAFLKTAPCIVATMVAGTPAMGVGGAAVGGAGVGG